RGLGWLLRLGRRGDLDLRLRLRRLLVAHRGHRAVTPLLGFRVARRRSRSGPPFPSNRFSTNPSFRLAPIRIESDQNGISSSSPSVSAGRRLDELLGGEYELRPRGSGDPGAPPRLG